jgi:transcriptional regulator
LIVHDDPAWVEDVVRRLSDHHEAGRPEPWSVDDAPAKYVATRLKAIVGIELAIARIEAKVKLGQDKSPADLDGVIAGLHADGDTTTATAIAHHRPDQN